jgi:Zn-dependent M28 family amino/carboxypeptidase
MGGLILFLFLAFFLWAYATMVNIRPNARKAKMEKATEQLIGDLEPRLRKHVVYLAEEIGERNLSAPTNLEKAAQYIKGYWQKIGCAVQSQSYTVHTVECTNLSAEIPGKENRNEILILGAHYDSVGGSPGANDNGSAVAALLEISRLLYERPQKKTIRFVAFPNEEPPFFQTKWMGSRVYARICREQAEKVAGMISLETIGYYSEKPGSQKYPLPFRFFYPDTGNFVGVVGNLRSKDLVREFAQFFMEGIDFPVECAATFGGIPGISWSDHSSFWKYDYPAIMVTDTALYRYPFYHTREDTPDKVDYHSLSRVTCGILHAAQKLAAQTTP